MPALHGQIYATEYVAVSEDKVRLIGPAVVSDDCAKLLTINANIQPFNDN
ncbi:hypothetical protein ACQ4M3_01045 [Leptolyngbya sp. AN03gr2]